jgi:hypothetical protein
MAGTATTRRRRAAAAAAESRPAQRRRTNASRANAAAVSRANAAAEVSLPNDLNAPTQANRYVAYIKRCMEYTHKREYLSNHRFHEE